MKEPKNWWSMLCLIWPALCFTLALYVSVAPLALMLAVVIGGGALFGVAVYLIAHGEREADGGLTFAVLLSAMGGAYGMWAGSLMSQGKDGDPLATMLAMGFGVLAGVLYRSRCKELEQRAAEIEAELTGTAQADAR